MKKLLLSSLTLLLVVAAFAAPKKFKLLKSTTNWALASNWTPAGIPQDGDTILIPAAIMLTLSDDIDLKNIYIDIFGIIILSGNNMKATLTGNSKIVIHTSGWIEGSKASQQIVMGNDIIFKGKDPILLGAQMATSVSNGFKPFIEPSVLPVTFTAFDVFRSSAGFLVKWTTTDESGASHYEVERSSNGHAWENIATVFAASNTKNTYSYLDKNTGAHATYYRIKQIDADGSLTYTGIRMFANANQAATPTITAVQHKITVVFAEPVKGKVVVDIIGVNGYVAAQQTLSAPTGTVQIGTAGLRGIYMVRVSNGQGLNTAKQIIL